MSVSDRLVLRSGYDSSQTNRPISCRFFPVASLETSVPIACVPCAGVGYSRRDSRVSYDLPFSANYSCVLGGSPTKICCMDHSSQESHLAVCGIMHELDLLLGASFPPLTPEFHPSPGTSERTAHPTPLPRFDKTAMNYYYHYASSR